MVDCIEPAQQKRFVSRTGAEISIESESIMPRNKSEKSDWKSLDEVVGEARAILASDPLYVVASKEGYVILNTAPELGEVGFRMNVDGSTTLIFTDHEKKKLSELHSTGPLNGALLPKMPI